MVGRAGAGRSTRQWTTWLALAGAAWCGTISAVASAQGAETAPVFAAESEPAAEESAAPAAEDPQQTVTTVEVQQSPPEGDAGASSAEEPEEDHFRAFYLEASMGMSYVNLGVLRNDNLLPAVEQIKGVGFASGAGFGFFIGRFTLGLESEIALHERFNLGTLALDIGVRGNAEHIEPYFRIGLGYAWLFNLDPSFYGLDAEGNPQSGNSVRGLAADVGLGIDYQINHLWGVGLGGDLALFNIRRQGQQGLPNPAGQVRVTDDGDALGIQVSALANVNLHF